MSSCGAEVLVANLKAQGVKHVFGIPGAKIDRVFDALLNSGIETVVCRHEQNASFIAAGLGKLTGKAGVCLVTSGPGCTNLVTGFATATAEGMPVVGLGEPWYAPSALSKYIKVSTQSVCSSRSRSTVPKSTRPRQSGKFWPLLFAPLKADGPARPS
jgi:glyoxylate carboligase